MFEYDLFDNHWIGMIQIDTSSPKIFIDTARRGDRGTVVLTRLAAGIRVELLPRGKQLKPQMAVGR